MNPRLAGVDEIRPTPGVGRSILSQIDEQLATVDPNTVIVTAQVPVGTTPSGHKQLKIAGYVKRPKGWSFMGWFDKELTANGDWGTGVAIRKEFGNR